MRGKDFEGKGSFMSTFNGAAVTGGNVWRHNANANILIGRTIPQGNTRYSVYVIYSLSFSFFPPPRFNVNARTHNRTDGVLPESLKLLKI